MIDLLTKHGTFHRQNISLPVENFLNVLGEFAKLDKSFFYTFDVRWMDESVLFSEIITELGVCFSLNLAVNEEIFKHQTAFDFYHTYINQYSKNNLSKAELRPTRAGHTLSGIMFRVMGSDKLETMLNSGIYEGYQILIHDPYELPTKFSLSNKLQKYGKIDFSITPHIQSTGGSLLNQPMEM